MATTASVHARLSVEGEALDVVTYSLSEGLSRVDSLVVTVTTRGQELPAPESLIGKEAEFALVREPDGQQREFCGDVLRVATASSADGLAVLRMELAPRLWRLSARTDCRVFRHKSVPDIVKEVIEGAGLSSDEQSYQLAESYPARDYVVQ
ncbi:MAG TPA: contractile injection system protein, VgrG/Pvc8 family, partial [Polyangiaceae bacterium]